ncbi:14278_t:CDS:2 [Dentiscutata erythropus]|uniref:14278_t:CDS:1 n=1 Tax=Dentiscutata erythropus TaxID=1348616 RepID=A0A9N9B0J1_9GLOM|nr:14278_t:CDS:2 [Dentiscutata erythropus]
MGEISISKFGSVYDSFNHNNENLNFTYLAQFVTYITKRGLNTGQPVFCSN